MVPAVVREAVLAEMRPWGEVESLWAVRLAAEGKAEAVVPAVVVS